MSGGPASPMRARRIADAATVVVGPRDEVRSVGPFAAATVSE
jgi:hypothetical protein